MNFKIRYECQNADCQQTFPRKVAFCVYCGVKQTIEKIVRIEINSDEESIQIESGDLGALNIESKPQKIQAVDASPNTAKKLLPNDAVGNFESHILSCVSNSYCDAGMYAVLIRHAKQACALDQRRAESVLTMVLEKASIANEKSLLDDLDALLGTFSGVDKKLSKKEWEDAIQSGCKPRPGCARGLDASVAQRFIVDFCRRHGVKTKSGLFSWSVP